MAAFEAGLERALDETAAEAHALYEKTTATWETNVNFTTRRTKYGRSVGTRSTIYKFVDAGTKPHIIAPKGNYPLRFATGGRAKTRPNYITSYQGVPGKDWRTAGKVSHPGTRARDFTKTIQKRSGEALRKRVKTLMKEVTR